MPISPILDCICDTTTHLTCRRYITIANTNLAPIVSIEMTKIFSYDTNSNAEGTKFCCDFSTKT